jgi:hypothetical protein
MKAWVRLLDGAILHTSDVVVQLNDGEGLSGIHLEPVAGLDLMEVTHVEPTSRLGMRSVAVGG